MKKVLLLGVLFLMALLLMVSCGDTPSVTTADTDPEDTPNVTTGDNGQVIPGELADGQDYIAVENTAKWETNPDDLKDFDCVGTGITAIQQVDQEYSGYTKTYYLAKDGGKTEISRADVRKLKMVAIAAENKNATAKKVDLVVSEIDLRVQPSWSEATVRAGSFLLFEFTTNYPITFSTTVTAKEGDAQSKASYTHEDITVSGSDGTYKGYAKCTVPRMEGKTVYLNICLSGGSYPVVTSIPLSVKSPRYDSEYFLQVYGDWEQIKDKTYLPRLMELFYTVYPKLYARFGTGAETKVVNFIADVESEHIAYSLGNDVVIQVDYANRKPEDIGWFSHELTHTVESYGNKLNYTADKKDGYGGWWRENLATYGGFRYFHWGTTTANVQIKDATDKKFHDWGYSSYGDCQLFFAYMDDKYPTTDKNGDGKITSDEYGLIDAIHFLIKSNTGSKYYDTPTATTSPIGKTVAEVTGGKYDCIEALRLQFEKDCKSGAWKFVGYRDYKDNFLTEDLPNVANPDYPMMEQVTPGNKTAVALANPVTTGNNVLTGATILEYSSQISKNPITNVIDGDLTKDSMWQSQSTSAAKDYKYQLMGISHSFVLDLGEVKSFDTYTVVNRGYISDVKTYNTNEWEILVSDDGKTWTSVDYQVYKNDNTRVNGPDIVSFNVGDVSARYIEFRIYTTDKGNTGTARLVEFMVFDN